MELVIRPAEREDLKEIWHLLHANTIAWTDERIRAELARLWVMFEDTKMLGVLAGTFETGKEKLDWVAIHPLYPEKRLREAMIKGVCSLLRLPEGTKKRLLSKCQLILGFGL